MTAATVPADGCDLDVRDVVKAFGSSVVLRGLSLSVPAGSLTAILGRSGSGKTTFLRVLAGFERADTGSVTIGGVVVDGDGAFVPPEHRRIGYVPQEGALFPHLTVARNVAFGLPRGGSRRARLEGLLALVGMEGMARRYPHQLSGGQQQRVALARALAVDPTLVLLDEPFSSLDAGLRTAVRSEVQAVLRASGATALLVTHDQDEALSWADQVAVLRDGRIGQLASPQELYTRPSDPDVAGFVGEANVLPGVAEPPYVRTVLGALAVAGGDVAPAGAPVTVLVRPEQVALVAEAEGAACGAVRDLQYYGHDAVVRVDLAGPAPAAPAAPAGSGAAAAPARPVGPLVVRVMGAATCEPGDVVGVAVRGPVLAWARPHDPEELPECDSGG